MSLFVLLYKLHFNMVQSLITRTPYITLVNFCSFLLSQILFNTVCIISQELIQNADDAGATEVKFLFDSRDNAFGTSSLVNVGLSKFQGPALYVYNNGLFKAQDWVGIESIMQGSKKKDPMAAGRFGLGFNSVYHVTGTIHRSSVTVFKIFLPGTTLPLH